MMSTTRPLPQRPGQTPSEPDGGFVYPPYPRSQPPFERHHSFPIPQSPGMYGGPVTHPPPGHDRGYFHPPPDPHVRPYTVPNGYPESNGRTPMVETNGVNGEGKKKRPRELSLSGREAEQAPSPRRPSTSKPSKPDSGSSDTKPAPSVLVREKKQKACSNCRRAKLKCILNDGESECVRCKSRSERCVFFPRSHDEDWQQTITQDVYSALGQLRSVSLAMNHMINHLVSHNMMPPLPPMEFPHGLPLYDVPDRDMTVLQGWNAEKTREDGARRPKRKGRVEEEEEEDEYRYEMPQHPINPPMMPLPPPQHMQMGPIPPSNGWVHISPDIGQQGMHRLPPYRAPGHPGQVQLTPTSELDLPPRNDMEMVRPGPSFPYPPLAPSPATMMTSAMRTAPLPQMPGQGIILPSPSVHNATPNSMHSSRSHQYTPPNLNGGLPQSAPLAISGPDPNLGTDIMTENVDEIITAAEKIPRYDHDGNPIIGSKDGRANLVQEGSIDNLQATSLVEHFQTNLAPFLFGYRLEIGRFPFLTEGLVSLTPFIFGVMCMLSSERVPEFYSHHDRLQEYVVKLLKNSPAESWQNFETSKADHNTDETIDKLDPELGIGPEEIVGACILAAYMRTDDLDNMSTIAEMAFTWARGWIKLLSGAPRWSFAENLGIVPQERKADLLDMSRVWLLCYVIQGTQQLGATVNRRAVPPIGHDPDFYCEQLIPPQASRLHTSPYDVILVYRAKLVDVLKTWYRKRSNLWNRGPNASFDLKRLASATNDQLDEWKNDFSSFETVTSDQSRQLIMFYDFARVMVNSHAVQKLEPGLPDTEPTRRLCLSKAVDAGLDFVQRCLECTPKQFASMPTYDLNLITAVPGFLLEAVCPGTGYKVDVAEGQTPLAPKQVRPLLDMLADKFDERHGETGGFAYQETADAVLQYSNRIENECQD